MTHGDGRDDPTRHDVLGQLGRGPVRHRATRILGRLTGDRDDPGDLIGSERARTPGPGVVTQDIFDRRLQGRGTFEALDADQGVEGVSPTPPPDPDAVPLAPEVVGDRSVLPAAEGEQDDLGSLCQPPRAGAGPNPPLEDLLLPLGDDHLGCLPWHDRLRTGVNLGYPARMTKLPS